MIERTEAIVLKSMEFRDTSYILTVYTRAFGKLSVIVKGAKGKNPRFGSSLQPMNYVSIVLYKKRNKDLHLVTQCDIAEPLRALANDIGKMSAAMGMIELVNSVVHFEEPHEALFDTLVNMLLIVNSATKNPEAALYCFETRLLDLLGFKPDFHRCSQCKMVVDVEKGGLKAFGMGSSGILCTGCAGRGFSAVPLSAGSVRLLQRFQELTVFDTVVNIGLTRQTRQELAHALQRYLQTHVEGFRFLKSEAVFAAIT